MIIARFRLEQSLPYVFALHERRDTFHNLRLDLSHPCWEQDDEQAVHAQRPRNAGVRAPEERDGIAQCIGHGIGDSPAGEPSVRQTDAYASARYGVAG